MAATELNLIVDLQEVVVYDHCLTDEEQRRLNDYFAGINTLAFNPADIPGLVYWTKPDDAPDEPLIIEAGR